MDDRLDAMLDLFCGAGLFSLSAVRSGCAVVGAIDIDRDACASYVSNHPVAPVCADVRDVDFSAWSGVDGIVASPPCTSYSCAAAGRRCDSDLPLEVVRAACDVRPRWVVVENVPSYRSFPSYRLLCDALARMGYIVYEYVLDSAWFGVPQRRRRLYVVASRVILPVFVAPRAAPVPVSTILDDLPFSSRGLAPATQARIARVPPAVERFVAVYRNGASRGWQSLDEPLLTVACVNQFLLVDRSRGHRMLSLCELRRAMGMPDSYVLCGSARSCMRQVGNAVVPSVAAAMVAFARGVS